MEALTRLAIERLSDEGRGIAHHAGKTCFVAGALPGETVMATRIAERSRVVDYRVATIESVSAQRVSVPCPLFLRCGGCELQHLEAQAQLAHKRDVVLAALARQARLEPRHLDASLESAPYGYRSRARLAVDAPRGRALSLGFRAAGSTDVIAVDECAVLAPTIARLPHALSTCLATLVRPRALGHIDVSVAETTAETRPVVGVRTVAALDADDRARLEAFATEHGAYLALEGDDGALDWLARPDDGAPAYLLPDFDLRIEYAPGDFVQGNFAVNRRLVARAVEWLAPATGAAVLDAFCGLGNFSLALARAGAAVEGHEVSRRMVDGARANARSNGVAGATFAVRDLHDATSVRLPADRFAAALLDPPRAGAAALVAEIARRRIPVVLYVSCLPSALGRDARILADAGYRLERLSLVDMFPQTGHIESMALFVRIGKARRSG